MTAPGPEGSDVFRPPDLPVASAADAGRLTLDVTPATLSGVRHAVRACARDAGLTGYPLDDFVMAVHELATNAVRHGGGHGHVDLRREGDTLLCDITDHGPGFGGAVPVAGGPPPAAVPGGRGLLLARLLTDTILISDSPGGVTVSITACLPAAAPVLAAIPAPPIRAETLSGTDAGRPVVPAGEPGPAAPRHAGSPPPVPNG